MSSCLVLSIASVMLVMMVSASDMRPEGECKAPEECGDSLLARSISSHRVSLRKAEHEVMQHLVKSRKPTEGLVVSLRQLATDMATKQENCSEEIQEVFEPVLNETQIVIDVELNASVIEQNRVNAAYARIVQCNTDVQASSSSSSVNATRSTHVSCRTEQAQLCSSESSLCGAFEAFRSSLSYPSCMYSGNGPASVTGECMQTLSIWLNAHHATFDQQKQACEGASEQCETKETTCDANQGSFEMSYCLWAAGINTHYNTYTTCFQSETESYHAVVAEVAQVIETNKAEYTAAVQTQCLIKALNTSTDVIVQAQVLATCNTVDTSPLDITYPDELPAMLSITPVSSVPCEEQHYSEMNGPFLDKSCEEWTSNGDGQVDLGGPNWPSASSTAVESLAACKIACDARAGCSYITWYEDLGCRTYTSCVDPVNDVPDVVKHIYKKQDAFVQHEYGGLASPAATCQECA